MVVSVIAPRFFDVFVPVDRRDDGVREYAPNVTEGLLDAEAIERSESGSGDEKRSSSDNAKAEKPL